MLTASNDVFNSISALRPKRHAFNLSYKKKFDCDMGYLYPICCEEVVPGDRFSVGNEIVVRAQPMVAPILDNISVKTEYFYVPFRILWDKFEDFYTGGKEGTNSSLPPLYNHLPSEEITSGSALFLNPKSSLGDYLGLPITTLNGCYLEKSTIFPNGFAQYAYNKIWNEYYRDENIDEEIELNNNTLLLRRWKKDYFTSALPFQQRGVAPSIFNNTSLELYKKNYGGQIIKWSLGNSGLSTFRGYGNMSSTTQRGFVNYLGQMDASPYETILINSYDPASKVPGGFLRPKYGATVETLGSMFNNMIFPIINYDELTSDLGIQQSGGGSTLFNVADLRLMFQVQKWLERQARGGARFNETLLSHFGVSPSDSRLQRPEYLGGSSQPLFVSEVLQTSETTTSSPQGNLSGRGLSVNAGGVFSKVFPEPGLVIGLFSIVPELTYSADGINKQWFRKSRFDFYFPEFAHLSEQKVYGCEIYLKQNGTEASPETFNTFGYQGIYDEYRHNRSLAVGNMRDTFDYWSLFRKFSEQPVLNSSFLAMKPSKRIFAVQNENTFIVNFANVIKAVRPIPKYAEPGLLDHF